MLRLTTQVATLGVALRQRAVMNSRIAEQLARLVRTSALTPHSSTPDMAVAPPSSRDPISAPALDASSSVVLASGLVVMGPATARAQLVRASVFAKATFLYINTYCFS